MFNIISIILKAEVKKIKSRTLQNRPASSLWGARASADISALPPELQRERTVRPERKGASGGDAHFQDIQMALPWQYVQDL